MKHVTIVLAFLMMLSKESLADTGEDLAKLEEFISRNPVGDEDYLLQMNSSYGWATVAVIIGWWDDLAACTDLIQGLKLMSNPRQYRCIPANEQATI